jgi:monomeric sarcosine oxidase
MRADVIIVGGGLAGSAAAWRLSERGRHVVLLEAFEPGHKLGSSHGSARIFRRAYPDPLYIRLTGLARDLWQELSMQVGEEFITITGAVDAGGQEPERMYRLLTEQGVPAELLTPSKAAARWPGIAFGPDDGPVLYHPEGGVLDPDRAMAAMQRLAAARGADIRHRTRALSVTGETVRTADEEFTAPVVVVAAGAWLAPLLGGQVRLPPLEVTQTQYFVFEQTKPREWPVFLRHSDPVLYALPAGSERPGALKVAVHGQGTVTTADTRDGVVNDGVRYLVRQFVMTSMPGLDPTPVAERTCLYTSTASEDFILDRRGPLVVASACSGHGAKFAPLTGELIADLADGKPQDERRFRLAAELPGTFPAQSASLLAGALLRP